VQLSSKSQRKLQITDVNYCKRIPWARILAEIAEEMSALRMFERKLLKKIYTYGRVKEEEMWRLRSKQEILYTSQRADIVKFIISFRLGSTAQRGLWPPPRSRGFLITHNDAPQSVGLLWTSNQLVVDTSTWQHTTRTKQTNIHAPGGIRTHDRSRRAAVDLRLRTCGRWDWHRGTAELQIIRINWDSEPSGYTDNPDNWIFLRK
jgi:hypothetical protein